MGVFVLLVGLVLGIALAKGLNLLFEAFGVDLPSSSMAIAPRTIIVALALGILAGDAGSSPSISRYALPRSPPSRR